MSKTKVDETVIVNTEAIAKMFNVSSRRVRQFVEEGVIDRVGYGRFNLVDTVSKYITFLKLSADSMNQDDITESLDYEKWLHEKAKREKAEIELSHLKKEMHSSGEIEEVMNNMIMNFRQRILSIPTKCALQLINQDDPKYVESIIEASIHEALIELSNYDPSQFVVSDDEVVEVGEEDGEKANS
ncbi:hypothetical protein [Lysinibacillus sphaericus]|uniref:hypothetical protein n=1 Tax=Lysinibacillus sphaericus TaxID=1421 RepID=UPI0018CFD553|nr:hypothetical protein [Lysinibacillus sphaericus]MBG9479405.1 hypothetical protein [Lysinibacillus sphaericus]MBG9479456.1 hypothetical protein [Lysinibacillus sphaericus]